MNTAYSNPFVTAADAEASARAAFIRNTYLHLALAIAAFVALETFLFTSGLAEVMARAMLGTSWLLVLGGFLVVSWIADWWANSDASKALQYLGLGLLIVAEAIIFVPLLYIAANHGGADVIPKAAMTTGVLFGGITITAFVSGKDFSFLRSFLMFGGLIALGCIVVGAIAGFSLGFWFACAMVVFAGVSFLFSTSHMIHSYSQDQKLGSSTAIRPAILLVLPDRQSSIQRCPLRLPFSGRH